MKWRLLLLSTFVMFSGKLWAQADLAITELTAPGQIPAGALFDVSFRLSNLGDTATPGQTIGFYYSGDNRVDQGDGLIGYLVAPPLAAGASVLMNHAVALPADVGTWGPTVYIGAMADLRRLVSESDEGNNRAVTAIVANGGVCEQDSFEPDSALASARPIELGDRQSRNTCDGSADWFAFNALAGKEYKFTTAEKVNNSAFVQLALTDAAGNVLATSSYYQMDPSLTWVAPASGPYYVRVTTTSGGQAYMLSMIDGSADLTDVTTSSPTQAVPGALLRFSDSLFNRGGSNTGAFRVGYYLSTDLNISTDDIFLDWRDIQNMPPETSNYTGWQESLASVPVDLAPGNYYFGAIADEPGAVGEVREHNNASLGTPIQISPSLCTPDAAENDDWRKHAVLVSLDTPLARNHCDDAHDWIAFDAITGEEYVIETSGIARQGISYLDLYDRDGATLLRSINPDADHTARIEWQAPASGRYFVDIKKNSSTANSAESEYTVTVFRRLALPDLKPVTTNEISGGYKAVIGGRFSFPLTVHNRGVAPAAESEAGFYLSTDWGVTTDDLLLLTIPTPAITSGGQYQTYGNDAFGIPATLTPGNYYFGAIADHGNRVTELSEINNVSRPLGLQLIAPPCAPDTHEQDDFPEQAQPLQLGVAQSHNLCEDSLDHMYLDIAGSGIYRFELTTAVQTTTLSIWDPTGNRVAFMSGTTELILGPGRHMVQVSGYWGAGTDYSIAVSLVQKLRSRDGGGGGGKGKNNN